LHQELDVANSSGSILTSICASCVEFDRRRLCASFSRATSAVLIAGKIDLLGVPGRSNSTQEAQIDVQD